MSQLEDFAAGSGFKLHKNIAYGRIGDIFFNVQYYDPTSVVITPFAVTPGGAGVQAEPFVTKYGKPAKVFKAQPGAVLLKTSLKFIRADELKKCVEAFAAYLTEAGYKSACLLCGSNDNIGYTFHSGLVREVCGDCHQKLNQSSEEMKLGRKQTGSYLRGTFGAILGGIIGIIPWVLIYLANFIAGISGFLMALFAYKGYKLTGGKTGRGMIIILIIVLVVFTYAAVVVNLTITECQFLAEEGYQFDALEIYKAMLGAPFMPDYFDVGFLWGQIALGWLFAGLGSFSFIRQANKEANNKDIEIQRLS